MKEYTLASAGPAKDGEIALYLKEDQNAPISAEVKVPLARFLELADEIAANHATKQST